MKKWLRSSILALGLLSLAVAPAVLAKEKGEGGGRLTPAPTKDELQLAPPEWDITCPNGRTAVCIGSEADCLFLCDLFCGTPIGTCVSV